MNEVSDSHDGLNNAKGKYGGWEGTAQRHQQQRERGKWKWTGEGGREGKTAQFVFSDGDDVVAVSVDISGGGGGGKQTTVSGAHLPHKAYSHLKISKEHHFPLDSVHPA